MSDEREFKDKADARDLGDPATDLPLTLRDVERFWSKVDRTGAGCHEWRAGTNAKGYGRVKIGGRSGRVWLAHRLAFLIETGEQPPLLLMHQCDNPSCCRVHPDHVVPGTVQQNARDAVDRGLRVYPERRSGTCANGHELSEDNVYRRKRDGYPVCRTCTAINAARAEAKPEVRERRRARSRAQHHANRDRRLAQMAARRQRIKEGDA